jgi:hypothetical protein
MNGYHKDPGAAALPPFTVHASRESSCYGDGRMLEVDVLALQGPGLPWPACPPNSRGLDLCWRTGVCVANTFVGSTGAVYPSSRDAWDFLERLEEGSLTHILSGPADVSFSSGGGTAHVSGNLLIEAYGQAAPVPIPGAIFLFAPGLVGLLLVRRHLTLHRRGSSGGQVTS